MTIDPITYCANHPEAETSLRCNNCEKPICPKCAVLTPTGYRCKQCVRGQQKVFDTAEGQDYVIGFVITLVLSFLGSLIPLLLGRFGLGWLIIFIAAPLGVGIAEAVRAAIRRRRSTRLFQVVALAAVIGSLPLLLLTIPGVFGGGLFRWLALLWQGLYTFTVTTSIYYRLRGINIR
jgi:hypothetical protein